MSSNRCFEDISSPRLSRLRFESFPNYTGDEKSSFMNELYFFKEYGIRKRLESNRDYCSTEFDSRPLGKNKHTP